MDRCVRYEIVDYGLMNKTVLITGCSSGFGLLFAARLSASGYNVYASMRDLRKDKDLKLELKRILNVLDEREKIIVVDYFGLTGVPKTLSDIGLDFSLTKERVRQIKEKALRKLRNESEILLDYMD